MDIAQIRTLLHVAELGTVSKAAERLNIAQPALSRQIRLLEQELGGALFVRHGRGMVPTALGRELLDPAARILGEIDLMREIAARGETAQVGHVRFGMPPTVSEIIAAPLVHSVSAAYPRLSLGIASGFSGHLLDWIKRDELDLAVCYDLEPDRCIRSKALMIEELWLVGGADSALDRNTAWRFAALAAMPLILPSALHGLRNIVGHCAGKAGIALKPVVEIDSFPVIVDLVRQGVGMTILPLAPIHDHLLDGSLRAAPIVSPAPMRTLILATPIDRAVSPAARCVANLFIELAGALVDSSVWPGRMVTASTVEGLSE